MKLTLLLTFLATYAMAQDSMADRLRKAVVEEESLHNQAAAEADYQAVLAQFDDERKTAATALFRLAECERKLGKNDQAKAAYQRVVQEFADQSKLAAQSSAVLASTYKVTPKAAPAGPGEAKREEARQRYRALLLQEINVANDQLRWFEQQYQLGVVSANDRLPLNQQKLSLERQLAAFDMGIMPAAIK